MNATKRQAVLFWLLAALALPSLAAPAAASGIRRIELPPESGQFPPGEGSDMANALCLTCHSVDYITTQPRLPRKAWAAEVAKMMGKYGAPIPPAYADPIADYLARTYGPNQAGATRPAKP